VAAAAPDVVATGNPGCILQMASAAERAGKRFRVVHPIELLDASIRGLTGG
jgi:glycolate oxidase iron-sulfur subunit